MRRDHREPVGGERSLPLTKHVVGHHTPGRRRCQRASAVCCCSIEMSPPNCSVRVSPHGDMGDPHDEPQGSAPGRPAAGRARGPNQQCPRRPGRRVAHDNTVRLGPRWVQLPAAAPTQGGAWTCGSASPAGCSSSRTAPASPPSPRRRRSSSARAARPTAIARGAAAPPPPRCRVRPLRRPARPLGPPPPTRGGMRFLTPANAPSSALEDQGPVGSLRQVAAVGAIPPRCPATAGAGRTRRAPNGSGAT
jgi:hypothetical protein